MYAKEQGRMKNLMKTYREGGKLTRSEMRELLRYICSNPIFSVYLSNTWGLVTLHIDDVCHGNVPNKATYEDVKAWLEEAFVHLTSLNIENVQIHLAPIRPHEVIYIGTLGKAKIAITRIILSHLTAYEKLGEIAGSFSDYIAKKAGADGLISLTEKMLGRGEWATIVKLALLSTGRYREDGEAIVRM